MIDQQIKILIALANLVIVLIINVTDVLSQQPISLGDNTPKDDVVAENVLGVAMGITGSSDAAVTYALLNSPVSAYFRVDPHTGSLITRRTVDRDMLCSESGLCCAQNTQNLRLSTLRRADNGESGSICSLRLDVAVTAGLRGDLVPTTRQVYVEIKDENDHSPVFSIPSHTSQYGHYSNAKYGSTSNIHTPALVLNISEAAVPGSHRLVLPLAVDIDSAPFNVQNYFLDSGINSRFQLSSSSSPERFFKLEVQKRELTGVTQFESDALITGLNLLLIAPLDRESFSLFEFDILAVDGGSPNQRTGTLSVQIRVTDANDHDPIFERSSYEKSVEEGQVFDTTHILKVTAHDQDEGPNARIRYSWWPDYDRFGSDAKLLEQTPVRLLTDEEIASLFGPHISPERLVSLQALPTYWFCLNERTGEIFIHRPLDYETKRGFVFAIVATNPDADDPTGKAASITRKSLKNSQSMTEVTINVINLNDEKPQISIDYVMNSDSEKHKQVKENDSPDHFIALIRVTDADASHSKLSHSPLEDPWLSNFQYSSIHSRSSQPTAGGVVTCELASHTNNYTLFHNTQTDVAAGVVEYVLKTQTPLDREREQRQFVIIRCSDDGTPSKTSTATVEVEILDQNDNVPEITVHTRISSTHRPYQSSVLSPIPRSRLADILQKSSLVWQRAHPSVEHPLVTAYDAGVPVILVTVPENRPPGTIVASLRGVDHDAGENGRVTFRILKEDRSLPRIIPESTPQIDQQAGRYPEGKVDLKMSPVVIHSDVSRSDLFKLESNGDITTTRTIDREQFSPLQDELYLFIEAQDWGQPKALSSYILLAVAIEDENDNPPNFILPQMNFPVMENLPAPRRIGEILVQDADAGTEAGEIYHEVLPDPPRVSEPPKHTITLFINPNHGRHDLPFVIDATPDGRFFLNVTRSLDRELEDTFRFLVQASDNLGPSHSKHTSTATITVSVVDVNDNPPEIIFPKPATATTLVHALSYLEMPDTEILSVNANDKDSNEENGKIVYELGSVITSIPGADSSRLAKTALHGDLFKLDPFKGLLKTQRRMSEDDIGEHWLQLIVRDTGTPPQQATQVIRLAVDRSPPQFASNNRARSSSHPRVPSNEYTSDSVVGPLYRPNLEWDGANGRNSGVVWIVVICLIIAVITVLFGLCFYLRHQRKSFCCLPDICTLFQKSRQASSSPYSNSESIERPVKVPKDNATLRKGSREASFQARVWSPIPAPPQGGDYIVSTSKRLPNQMGAFVSIANANSDGTDFFERSSKLYTDCYHVGMPCNQGPVQSSRFVPVPSGTFKSIVSPDDEFSAQKVNFYNSATMAVQSTAISPLHRPNFLPTSARYGETLPLPPLYAQSVPNHCRVPITHSGVVPAMVRYPDGLQQHQQQNRPSRSKTLTTSTKQQQQGSCDLLSYASSLNQNQSLYKSEPMLAGCDDLESELDSDIDDPTSALVSNGGHSNDFLGSNLGKKICITPPPMTSGRTLENYAVSFPKPQASYV
nr:protocadherin 1 [Hymenolepis microstoma]